MLILQTTRDQRSKGTNRCGQKRREVRLVVVEQRSGRACNWCAVWCVVRLVRCTEYAWCGRRFSPLLWRGVAGGEWGDDRSDAPEVGRPNEGLQGKDQRSEKAKDQRSKINNLQQSELGGISEHGEYGRVEAGQWTGRGRASVRERGGHAGSLCN